MKEKIAFVCQRYGLEVNGGSELYCRQLAEKLVAFYDVEVYTSCAIDYVTWDNEYTPGMEIINGVTVRRFRTSKSRNPDYFQRISREVFHNPLHSNKKEMQWIEEQGPVCPELLSELKENHHIYKAVIFMTYLYYLAVKGLSMNFDNAILIPTVHDEAPVYLKCYEAVFNSAKAFIWNTIEEKNFAEKRFPKIKGQRGIMAGIGVDVPVNIDSLPDRLKSISYVVYAGRIDESKGCGRMFEYFVRYKKQYGGNLKLVLMGKSVMEIPQDSDIVNLGFVSEELKFAVMKSAKVLLLFSEFESLSMVVLESMTMGRPVIVNGKCEVLKGHCIRSNAGLYFDNYAEFAGILNYLCSHELEYSQMCENGKKYVNENYQWDKIVEKICGLVDWIKIRGSYS